MAETMFGEYRPGSRVNLEVDVIARYLERLVLGDAAADPGGGGTINGNPGGERLSAQLNAPNGTGLCN